MFQQYVHQSTQKVHEILQLAVNELLNLHLYTLTSDFILLGLLLQDKSEALDILSSLLPDHAAKRKAMMDLIYQQHPPQQNINIEKVTTAPDADKTLELASQEANRIGDTYISTDILLVALFDDLSGPAAKILKTTGLTQNKVRAELLKKREGNIITTADAESRVNVLKEFTVDLTEQALKGELDPVIGREEEMRRVIQTLSRRKKNNPVLMGEAGVGKTVIVEGIAQRMAEADVPETLLNKRILSLDMAQIVAGSNMRGEFEQRLISVRDAIIEAEGRIILFIDELHTVVGSGATPGGLDAPSLLKTALAKGSLQVIGADTTDEYRKYVESDKALERRFQPILVKEPTVEETVQILEGISPKYEKHHQISYDSEALQAAARLSERYIADRNLPDKAVDLLDEAGAQKRLQFIAMPTKLRKLEKQRQRLLSKKQAAFDQQDYETAASHQMELSKILEELDAERQAWQQTIANTTKVVTAEDIAEVVAKWTSIPVARMVESEADKLGHMETNLHKRIAGQDDAIRAVSHAIRRNRAGISESKRPIGSFLFLGPTGSGKTALAKALTEFLLDDETRIIQLDMSEYMERHEVSKMIGAPPGYIGYGEGGQLTEKVRRAPYSVVLLDEIEKAHPDVFNMLLQILEDGHLTDAQGRKVSFRNTVIIGTSNLGVETLGPERKQIGFMYSVTPSYEEAKRNVLQEVKRFFKPEFLNRLDDIIVFHFLERNHVLLIAHMMIAELKTRLEEKEITLIVDEAVIDKLATDGFDINFGARPLRREIEKQLENPLASYLINQGGKTQCVVDVTLESQEICFHVNGETVIKGLDVQ
ncbi:ATP-dependent Clp protease ATP-binding subunit [Photobacterium sp. SDRW27]|uniref:ATP-dependent Clp protease ATP-binding subunit n=1 Tax=Photobacterium obscurum TaxID=2829490 RepID=UPI0022435DB6|nr:ATP-dependent Clp protease ATP-binding subunit [Photobacterium obscurum]MCW8327453.1 ATP-dependent Clp protease ATP-binding subunit [Photobacterium obscurum]